MGYTFPMPLSRMRCPGCGAELTHDSRKARERPGGKDACPYEGLALADLRASHDRIYFGRWRKMDSSPIDVQRAYHQIGRHLSAIGQFLRKRDLPAARRDLALAIEAFQAGDPREGSPDLLRFMDHALSYAHRVIDDLLHEEGLPSHDPMAFAEWYDAAEVPFKEEW